MENFSKYQDQAMGFVVEYGGKLVVAILILIIGLWITGVLTAAFRKFMDKRGLDQTLKPFLTSLFNSILKILVVLSALGTLGVEMTSFIAILGAAGLAIGMALSGTLQNFAGGVMLLIFKPYKVGDFIEAQGYSGSVESIQIFVTILKTPDNKTIFIPNGPIANNALINYSTEPQRRVDWTFGIAYGDDIQKAQDLLSQLIQADERILKSPEPFIALHQMADSSVNLVVRCWVDSGKYWPVYFDMNRKVYDTFNKEGINIPFPQMDVHLHQS
ncbi:mechanosensitive ion channel family protein [Persicobacter sp. CCB-QB2]|uniref:mechanosensitive ion channel family protein n=1 Tax=Persicobacter sp. CCB-QB2 TaxID=1561025 RepID=UPI0006A9DAAB|nr:mechanosensitive ion channel domain-containing protein [Persicobacter sp. CCB-QB2]